MADALPYTRRTRIPGLLGVTWELFKEIFCHVETFDALPYTRGTRILRLLGVKHYLNK